MLEIDGSYREGGGQILRTALTLSCLYRKPFRIFKIRHRRKKPGLMPQHLAAVKAALLLSRGEAEGDNTGSQELLFIPREIKGGTFFYDIGTAGSTSLVLQTLIPAAAFHLWPLDMDSEERGGEAGAVTDDPESIISVSLKGGTHVPFSPSFQYIAEIFIPLLKKVGISVDISIGAYGFYPKGGGAVRAVVHPVRRLSAIEALGKGGGTVLKGYSGVANLPVSIAERQKKAMEEKIYSSLIETEKNRTNDFSMETEILRLPSIGTGTFAFLKMMSGNSAAGFTSLGERGKRAEVVGEETASEFLQYHATGAAFDSHIADQIVLYLAMCREESAFTTSAITEHLLTNLWIISRFHQFRYEIQGEIGKPGIVKINPRQSRPLS